MSSEISSLPECKITDVQIKLLRAIQNDEGNLNQSKLSDIIDKAASTTSRQLRRLVENEYLLVHDRGRHNYYELRERGKNFLQTMGADSEMLDRAHAIMLTFPIKREPSDGFCERDFRVNEGMRNWSQRLRKNLGSNLVIYINDSSSISIGVKEVWARDSKDAILIAYFKAENAIRELIQEHPKLVVGEQAEGCIYPCRISKQSHAIQKDLFAKKSAKFNLHFSNEDNNGIFEVDQSHKTPEIEFTNSQYGAEDFKKYESFIRSILDGSISVEALEYLTTQYEKIQEESKNQDTKKESSNTNDKQAGQKKEE